MSESENLRLEPSADPAAGLPAIVEGPAVE